MNLSMRQHIAKVTSSCFFRLRRLRKLNGLLDIEALKRLVRALKLWLTYYNAPCPCSPMVKPLGRHVQ